MVHYHNTQNAKQFHKGLLWLNIVMDSDSFQAPLPKLDSEIRIYAK